MKRSLSPTSRSTSPLMSCPRYRRRHDVEQHTKDQIEPSPDCLIVLHVVTQLYESDKLGCDESSIIQLTVKLVDLTTTQSPQLEVELFDPNELQLTIKPTQFFPNPRGDEDYSNSEPTFQGQTFKQPRQSLSVDAVHATGLSEEELSRGLTLEEALTQLTAWLVGHQLDVYENLTCTSTALTNSTTANPTVSESRSIQDDQSYTRTSTRRRFCLATFGQEAMRLIVHRELLQQTNQFNGKGVRVEGEELADENRSSSSFLNAFIDVRKTFDRHWPQAPSQMAERSIDEMIQYLTNQESERDDLEINQAKGCQHVVTPDGSCDISRDIIVERKDSDVGENHSSFSSTDPPRSNPALQQCRQLARLIQLMTRFGADWSQLDVIQQTYQPAIVRLTDQVDDATVVRSQGLPWQASDVDLFAFFHGLTVADGGIALVLTNRSRRNGSALVRFANQEQRDLALCKHRHHMGDRYIEVYRASAVEFLQTAACSNDKAEAFLSRITSADQALIRMRGLPYTATSQDIIDFVEQNCRGRVQFGEQGVLFVYRRPDDNQPSGDAFVLLSSRWEAREALTCHQKYIGTRYVEVFATTPAELNQVINAIQGQSVKKDMYTPSLYPSCSLISPEFSGAENRSLRLFDALATTNQLYNSSNSTIDQSHLETGGRINLYQLIGQDGGDCQFLIGQLIKRLVRITSLPPTIELKDVIGFLCDEWCTIQQVQSIHIVFDEHYQPCGEVLVLFANPSTADQFVRLRNMSLYTSVVASSDLLTSLPVVITLITVATNCTLVDVVLLLTALPHSLLIQHHVTSSTLVWLLVGFLSKPLEHLDDSCVWAPSTHWFQQPPLPADWLSQPANIFDQSELMMMGASFLTNGGPPPPRASQLITQSASCCIDPSTLVNNLDMLHQQDQRYQSNLMPQMPSFLSLPPSVSTVENLINEVSEVNRRDNRQVTPYTAGNEVNNMIKNREDWEIRFLMRE